MRRVRPTLRILKELPPDTYSDPIDAENVQRNRWDDMDLCDLAHPLLADAASFLEAGALPQPHQSSTQAAGRKVYEVRSRSGAAWRGAVLMDDDQDPWLVYAERHDRFHGHAAQFLRSANAASYMPRPIDYKLRDREEARIADQHWQASLLEVLIATVRRASEERGASESVLPLKAGMNGEYRLRAAFEHDEAAESGELAHESSSLVSLTLWLSPGYEGNELYRIVQVLVPFLKVQDANIDPVFDLQGRLVIMAVVSQAKLIQMLASSDIHAHGASARAWPEPTHLHYVGERYLAEAFVNGNEVRAVCGEWFVPTRGEGAESAMPICPRCESGRPTAQYVLDLIRKGSS